MPTDDLSSGDSRSPSSKLNVDGTNTLIPDAQTNEPTISVKTDNDDNINEPSSSLNDSTQPDSNSSVSLFGIVETIFVKKEDIKSAENIEQSTTSTKEEPMNTKTVSEEIKQESEP